MDAFERFMGRVGYFSGIIGSVSFLAVMVLITLNIITRIFKLPIQGTYELSEIITLAGGAFTLAYAALYEANVKITVLTGRLPKQTQTILQIFSSFLCLILWTVICWQAIDLVLERGLRERTVVLEVLVMPSRIIWIIGLVFLALLYFRNIVKGVRR